MSNFYIYCLIGIFNTIIHWSIFLIFYFLEVKQFFCNFLGFCCAVFFSYIVNSNVNFKSKKSMKKFGLFFLIMGWVNLAVGGLADKFSMFPIYTLVVTTILSLFLGYYISKYLVFKVGE